LLAISAAWASGYDDFVAGLTASQQGKSQPAIDAFTRALTGSDLAPSLQPIAYLDRGRAYWEQGDLDRASADFTAAIRLKPDFADAYALRAELLLGKGAADDSIADASKALSLNEHQAGVYDVRGMAYALKGEIDRATADLDTAIRISPTAGRYVDRGNVYRRFAHYESALSNYAEAIAIDPKYYSAYFERAITYELVGQLSDARADIENLLDPLKFPESSDASFAAGRISWLLDNFPAADRQFQTAFDKAGNANARDYIALWEYLAKAREAGDGSTWVAQKAADLDFAAWPGPLLNLYMGKASADEVLASASSSGSGSQTPQDRKCEADFYIAELHLLHKKQAEATSLFQDAAKICNPVYIESTAAQVELALLKQGQLGK
jgi:tetratricopeptide (TPR) repeat protein